MDNTTSKAPPATDKLRIELETNGPVSAEAGSEVKELLQRSDIPKPKGHFRPVEFKDEDIEKAHEQLCQLAALSPQRDALVSANPPTAEEKAKRLTELEAGIRNDMRVLGFVRIELHAVDDDPFELFTVEG